MKLFYKKVSTLPLTLVGVSQREARETAQRFSRPVAHREGGFTEPSPPPTGGHSRLPARSSAERCPLGTSAPHRGRRDLALRKQLVAHLLGSPFGGAGTAAAVTERASCQRPAHTRVPPPSLIPKGGTRLGRLDRKARRKPPWHRRCHQETPGEGFLRKTVHRTIFLFSCAC